MNANRSISSTIHRSHSDRDLPAFERRVTRTRLVSSSSSSNLQTYSYAATNSSARKMSANSQLPWDQLQKWLYGIAIVTFDLEIGHSIESVIPSHCKLSEEDRANLSFLAFPDTNSNCAGDIQYHFRLDHQSTLPSYYQQYNAFVPAALQVEQNSLFGYVNFRQVRDKTLKRGYFQKSFVILSKLPFFSLFATLSHQLAVHFFENGLESLESCCYAMNSLWPELEPGKTLVLPVLDQALRVRIPTQGEKPFAWADLIRSRPNLPEAQTANTSNHVFKFPIDDDAEVDLTMGQSESEQTNDDVSTELRPKEGEQKACMIPYVHGVNTYRSLSGVLTHIQLLWELVLLNEPIAVLGNFPSTCSETVQALVHIIWPLRYAADYRPFLTVQNAEFHGATSKMTSSSSSAMIVGVTNPLFSKMIDHWPHIIRIDDYPKQDQMKKKHESFLLVEYDQESLSINELEDSIELSASPPKPNISTKKLSTHAKPYKRAETAESNNFHVTFAMKAGLYTKYKPYLQRDKTILRKLQSSRSQQRPDTVQNAFLRRFFLELTQSFLIPLERYFTGLLPLRKMYYANRDVPVLKNFDQEDFFKTLDQYGPQLTSGLKGDWKDLYKHFFSSANFRLWLTNRQQEGNAKIYSVYVETIANCRLEQDFRFSKLTEIELVDLVLKFKQLIRRLESNDDEMLITLDRTLRNDYTVKLKLKMQLMIDEHLSNDMKSLLFQSIAQSST